MPQNSFLLFSLICSICRIKGAYLFPLQCISQATVENTGVPSTFVQIQAQQRKSNVNSSTEHFSKPSNTTDVRCKPKDNVTRHHLHMIATGVDFTFSSLLLSLLLLNLSINYFQGLNEKQQWWNPSDNNSGADGRSHHPLLGAVVGMVESGCTLEVLQPTVGWCLDAPQSAYYIGFVFCPTLTLLSVVSKSGMSPSLVLPTLFPSS